MKSESSKPLFMPDPDVPTPHEIASYLCDAAMIDRATANTLDQRYAEGARQEDRIEGITAAVKKAEAECRRTRGGRQKAGALKVLSAVRGMLPPEVRARQKIAKAQSQGYRRGYRDGKRGGR
ncbi:MAG: hypothetical protein ACHQRJ_14455 [Alphaproteobacteria bacterium]